MLNKKVTVGNKVLRIIKEISQGSYGKVYLVENTKDDKEKFALKVTIAQNQERFDLSDKEISFLKEFSKEQNDFFVQYIDSKIKHKNGSYKIYLLMEYCEQGNLFDFIGEKQKLKESFNESEIIEIIKQINNALIQIHSLGYQYRDLKIENILVFPDNKIKLCDFGSISNKEIDFSSLDQSQSENELFEVEKLTTLMYRPPEMCDMYLRYTINQQADMWMLGCIGFILMFFWHPFFNASKLGIIQASIIWPENIQYSQSLIDFVKKLFTVNPSQRLTDQQAKNMLENFTQNNWTLVSNSLIDLNMNTHHDFLQEINIQQNHIDFDKEFGQFDQPEQRENENDFLNF